jgi:hypothetical protein
MFRTDHLSIVLNGRQGNFRTLPYSYVRDDGLFSFEKDNEGIYFFKDDEEYSFASIVLKDDKLVINDAELSITPALKEAYKNWFDSISNEAWRDFPLPTGGTRRRRKSRRKSLKRRSH